MSLYRCAICGSSNVTSEEKQEKSSRKKGILNSIFPRLFKKTGKSAMARYYCKECGQVLSYPMPSFEKKRIENCLANPIRFEKNLIEYKQKYRYLEWEDSSRIRLPKTAERDVETQLAEYFEKAEAPLKWDEEEIAKNLNLNYETVFLELSTAIIMLMKKGFLKPERIGSSLYLAYVTDMEERVELALTEEARSKGEQLAEKTDYTATLKELLSKQPMTWEEIYHYLESSGYLPEEVRKAVEKNSLVSKFFTLKCLHKWLWDKDLRTPLYICEKDGHYKLKEAGALIQKN